MADNVVRIPDHAPQPQDHLKKKAKKKKRSAASRRAEARGGIVTVEHRGVTLRFPIGGDVPLRAVMAFKRGDEFEGTRLLLGDEQWEAFLDTDPTTADFLAVGEKLQEASGNR